MAGETPALLLAPFDQLCYYETWAGPRKTSKTEQGQSYLSPGSCTAKKGSDMITPSLLTRSRFAGSAVMRSYRTHRAAFTLIEMLVVITIIGILAGLITGAAIVARKTARNAAIAVELSNLDAACKAYKEKFGEYPPDFAGLNNTNNDPTATGQTYQKTVQNQILRHLAVAFPRYVPGKPAGNGKTGWDGFRDDVKTFWKIDINTYYPSPSTALVFWLGGKPEWYLDSSNSDILPGDAKFDKNKPVRSLLGFSANPVNPFDASTSRAKPFFEFDIGSVGWIRQSPVGGLAYWPKEQGVTDKTSGPLVYFRAENHRYTMNGELPPTNPKTTTGTNANVKSESGEMWPAVNTELSNFEGMDKYDSGKAVTYTWVNQDSIQIFASGLDQKFAKPQLGSDDADLVAYPTGETYRKTTSGSSFDDVTNFSRGTLESKMP
jgi:prepilin-type N-terminal cleavage/methylation domain-containing protein